MQSQPETCKPAFDFNITTTTGKHIPKPGCGGEVHQCLRPAHEFTSDSKRDVFEFISLWFRRYILFVIALFFLFLYGIWSFRWSKMKFYDEHERSMNYGHMLAVFKLAHDLDLNTLRGVALSRYLFTRLECKIDNHKPSMTYIQAMIRLKTFFPTCPESRLSGLVRIASSEDVVVRTLLAQGYPLSRFTPPIPSFGLDKQDKDLPDTSQDSTSKKSKYPASMRKLLGVESGTSMYSPGTKVLALHMDTTEFDLLWMKEVMEILVTKSYAQFWREYQALGSKQPAKTRKAQKTYAVKPKAIATPALIRAVFEGLIDATDRRKMGKTITGKTDKAATEEIADINTQMTADIDSEKTADIDSGKTADMDTEKTADITAGMSSDTGTEKTDAASKKLDTADTKATDTELEDTASLWDIFLWTVKGMPGEEQKKKEASSHDSESESKENDEDDRESTVSMFDSTIDIAHRVRYMSDSASKIPLPEELKDFSALKWRRAARLFASRPKQEQEELTATIRACVEEAQWRLQTKKQWKKMSMKATMKGNANRKKNLLLFSLFMISREVGKLLEPDEQGERSASETDLMIEQRLADETPQGLLQQEEDELKNLKKMARVEKRPRRWGAVSGQKTKAKAKTGLMGIDSSIVSLEKTTAALQESTVTLDRTKGDEQVSVTTFLHRNKQGKSHLDQTKASFRQKDKDEEVDEQVSVTSFFKRNKQGKSQTPLAPAPVSDLKPTVSMMDRFYHMLPRRKKKPGFDASPQHSMMMSPRHSMMMSNKSDDSISPSTSTMSEKERLEMRRLELRKAKQESRL
jgi:hypothetical protein